MDPDPQHWLPRKERQHYVKSVVLKFYNPFTVRTHSLTNT
jgi:hypothetical protein